MSLNIRDKQIAALKQMLNFNVPQPKGSFSEPVWKLLVYDRCGQDIISPLLSVKELRDMGITLHMLLHSDRDPIPEVPAIYFVAPTDENIMRIAQDFRNELYDQYYLNFVSPVSRQHLEDLASAALQANSVANVSKVFDQYLNFITVENDLFLLKHNDRHSVSYYAINRGDVKDTEIESIMDNIVDCLFSVFATLGTVPIIRSPKGNAAEMVAEKLDKRIRENLRDSRNSLFLDSTHGGGQFSFQRPLLVVLDRNMDMATPLHHTWTYQALAHDVLGLSLNRVTLEEAVAPSLSSEHVGAKPRKKTKTFDLTQADKFWQQHKGSPFPTVAEAVQEELEAYRAQEDEVKKLKAAMGLEGDRTDEAITMLSDNTAKLTSAVSSLPELLERKRLIDMHTSIATAILEHIKARKLDLYFETEEKLLGRQALDRSLLDLINDPEAGTAQDKLRLILIAFVLGHDGALEYEDALQRAGCDLSALRYLRRWKDYTRITAPQPMGSYGGGPRTVGMFSKLMSQGSQFVMEGVKNLVVKKHKLPITRLVDALMELKSLPETDDFRYLDPKLLGRAEPRAQAPFQEAVVFVLGGGNYIEYQNLLDYTKGKSKKAVYGCTQLVNAAQFLEQLSQLGTEIK